MVITACAAQKNISGSEVSYVQMQRTPCFGRCPYYKLEIYSDGLVRYTGIQFTDTGIYEKNIGAERAKKLLDKFSAKKIDTLQKEYKMNVADLPGLNFTFRYNNTVKEVRNAEFGPVFLREAALEIDQLVKENIGDRPKMDNTWKKISDSPKGD